MTEKRMMMREREETVTAVQRGARPAALACMSTEMHHKRQKLNVKEDDMAWDMDAVFGGLTSDDIIVGILENEDIIPEGEDAPVVDLADLITENISTENEQVLFEDDKQADETAIAVVHKPSVPAAPIAPVPPPAVFQMVAVEKCKTDAEEERAKFKRERRELKRKRGDRDVPEERGRSGASMEEKYERRLQLNRESAAASRARRDVYVDMLEKSLTKHEMDLYVARAEIQRLESLLAKAGGLD